MDRSEWEEVAVRRVRRILSQRRVASRRQLEVKISEAGPMHLRANPHHVTSALNFLLASDEVVEVDTVSAPGGGRQPTILFAPVDWNPSEPFDAERLRRVKTAYEEFLGVTQNEDNGESLQIIVQKAIEETQLYHPLSPPGKAPPSGTVIAGQPITGSGVLDHYLIYLSPPGIPIGVEDKNYRDWMYPGRPDIRALLRKCHAYKMLPVLVTRKIHFKTRLLFSYLGAVAFQTHFQCFLPKYANRLADARHKDGLGFADMRFTSDPPPHVTKLFSETLPRLIEPSWDKFNSNSELIRAYSHEEINYRELTEELGIVDSEEDEEVYGP